MVKFGILASVIPLIAVTGLAGSWASPATQPCIATPSGPVSLSVLPWRATMHVSFADHPDGSAMRVQLVDDPASADFVVADDSAVDSQTLADGDACRAAAKGIVTIDRRANADATAIYLSSGPDDDLPAYRIYVRSKRVTAQEAAAMIVAAHRQASATGF